MIHEVEVSNLMFNKSTEDKINFKKYDINVDLEEELSNEEKTVLKYSLDLTSNPKNSVINISGNTTLSGEQEEIENFLKQENEKTPEVVSLIYQELFPLMYIISKNMNIPSPAHTLSQNKINEFEEQNENFDSIVEKTEPKINQVENNEDNSNQLINQDKETDDKTNTGLNDKEDQKVEPETQ